MHSVSLMTPLLNPVPLIYWCCACQDFHRMQFTITTGVSLPRGNYKRKKEGSLIIIPMFWRSASCQTLVPVPLMYMGEWGCHDLNSKSKIKSRSKYKLEKVCLRLTGYLLDLVDHHKGIRQAHLHRVIDGADLWHLSGDLKEKKVKSITRTMTIWLGHAGLAAPAIQFITICQWDVPFRPALRIWENNKSQKRPCF